MGTVLFDSFERFPAARKMRCRIAGFFCHETAAATAVISAANGSTENHRIYRNLQKSLPYSPVHPYSFMQVSRKTALTGADGNT